MVNKTLYEFLISLRLSLSDVLNPANPSGLWPQAKLIEWTQNGVISIGTYVPQELIIPISCIARQVLYDLPSGFRAPLRVEYPTGNDPPQFLLPGIAQAQSFNWRSRYSIEPSATLRGRKAIRISSTPLDDESITVLYKGAHRSELVSRITAATRASLCLITWTNHGFITGDQVDIRDITLPGWSTLNGKYSITVVDPDTFTIPVDTSGYPAAYDPDRDLGSIYATLTLDDDCMELIIIYISWCAQRERLNLSSQDPASTSLIISQYSSNADRMWRNYTETANRMAKQHMESGPTYSAWTMDGFDPIY
jgi:hypothetical protein